MNRNGSVLAWLKLIVLSLVSWAWGYAVKLVLLVLAVPVNLGLAFISRARRLTWTYWSDDEVLNPRWYWLYIYGNDEHGIDGPRTATSPNLQRWVSEARVWSMWRRILSWNLLRNSVFNLRFSRFAVHVQPERIEWVGNSTDPRKDWLRWQVGAHWQPLKPPFWAFCRQGWRTGLYYIRASGRTTRLGFELYPSPPADRPLEFWQSVGLQLWRKP